MAAAEGLPGRERLGSQAAFRRVYEHGDAYRGRLLIMLLLRDASLQRGVGFVSSRKVGAANRRNRARRLMRESYRRLKLMMLEDGRRAHYVFVARSTLPGARLRDVYEEMRGLMVRAGVIDADSDHPLGR